MSEEIICSLCSVICNQLKTHTVPIALQNKTYLCLPCSEIQDLLSNDTNKKETPIKLIKQIKPIKSNQIINSKSILTCPKCKITFVEIRCKCGFKNPLYK